MALIVVIAALWAVSVVLYIVYQILAPIFVLLARGVGAWFRRIFRG